MTIQQLSIAGFRNLKDTTLDLHEQINIVHGDNGAGKTSLLEALSVICQGRSFRTSRLSHCISRNKDHFILFARMSEHRCGFRYGQPRNEIRIDSEPARRIADLARITPVLVIDHRSIELISGSPSHRRQYIDWLVFHVEPAYSDIWSKGQSILKQRNAILRQGKDLKLLDYWDELLVEQSLLIDRMRSKVLEYVLEDYGEYEFKYQPGFDRDYSQQLGKDRTRDLRQGYTSHAYNRADIRITLHGSPVTTTESRGQIKLLAFELKKRALKMVQERTGKTCVVLLDDISSELDRQNLSKLYASLLKLQPQLVTTGLSMNSFPELLAEGGRMFHVEHGMISSNSNR